MESDTKGTDPYRVFPPLEILYGFSVAAIFLYFWVPSVLWSDLNTIPPIPRLVYLVGGSGMLLLTVGKTVADAHLLYIDGDNISRRWLNLVETSHYRFSETVDVSRVGNNRVLEPPIRVVFVGGRRLTILGSCYNYRRFRADLDQAYGKVSSHRRTTERV